MAESTAVARQTATELADLAPDPWRFQRWAFEQQTGNSTRKALLSMLAMMADKATGHCEAKQATLAKGIEAGERAVRGHLKALERDGLITRRAQFRRDRGRRGDEFLLLAPWVEEWPDGQPLDVQPADLAGGSNGRDLPPPPERGDRPPRNVGSGQELPLGNDHLKNGDVQTDKWPGVPDELRRDAEELLRSTAKVGGRVVTAAEMQVAAAALAEFNRQAESDFGLGAQLTRIVGRVRERPSWGASKHVRLVQSAWRLRWWEKRGGSRPEPRVIYGNKDVFEQVAQDAMNEAAAREALDRDRGFRGKRWPDGRTYEELTPAEQANAREAVVMGLRPWEPHEDPPPRVNGHGGNGVVTAATFADVD